jgi:molecular chaperone GrpE
MTHEADAPRFPSEPSEPDDIEILEIVGMDEAPEPRSRRDEVVVSFDDDRPAPAPTVVDDDARERLLRLRADFENLKKRVEREREEYYRHATGALVARLLPVLDNLERALETARQQREAGDPLAEGVALVHRQLLEELRREGLRAVEATGAPFDPEVHEAVATDLTPGLPPHTVVEELQRGYFFEERLLRPALVRVSVSEGRPDLGDFRHEDA